MNSTQPIGPVLVLRTASGRWKSVKVLNCCEIVLTRLHRTA
jgi:hypothetical protein